MVVGILIGLPAGLAIGMAIGWGMGLKVKPASVAEQVTEKELDAYEQDVMRQLRNMMRYDGSEEGQEERE